MSYPSMPSSVLFAKIETTSLGAADDAVLIVAVPGKKIRVLSMVIDCDIASTYTLRSAGAETAAITGSIGIAIGVAQVWVFNPYGWCETDAGAALDLLNGPVASSDYSGCITYTLTT